MESQVRAKLLDLHEFMDKISDELEEIAATEEIYKLNIERSNHIIDYEMTPFALFVADNAHKSWLNLTTQQERLKNNLKMDLTRKDRDHFAQALTIIERNIRRLENPQAHHGNDKE
jgi:hypothetical protein